MVPWRPREPPLMPAPHEYDYRTKITLAVSGDGRRVGLHRSGAGLRERLDPGDRPTRAAAGTTGTTAGIATIASSGADAAARKGADQTRLILRLSDLPLGYELGTRLVVIDPRQVGGLLPTRKCAAVAEAAPDSGAGSVRNQAAVLPDRAGPVVRGPARAAFQRQRVRLRALTVG